MEHVHRLGRNLDNLIFYLAHSFILCEGYENYAYVILGNWPVKIAECCAYPFDGNVSLFPVSNLVLLFSATRNVSYLPSKRTGLDFEIST